MKPSEIIEKNRTKISESMVEHFRTVYECYGRIQYAYYVWSDGELEILEQCHGDGSWLKEKDSETRYLIYVGTIKAPCFDPWMIADKQMPEDEDERAEAEEEIIDWVMESAKSEAEAIIDNCIEELEREGC